MFRNKHYVALGAVTLTTVLVLNLPSRPASRLKSGVGGLFLPLFGLANATRQLPREAKDAVTPRSQLIKEIEQLRQENDRLKLEAEHAQAVARENDSLRAAIGWQRQEPWKLKFARVVMRDPANWWRTVWINLGSRDGLRENLPVLTTSGLIGRVSSVGYATSQVTLIGDPNCRVSARVEDPANDVGVLTAGGPLDNSLVNLTYLSSNANLKPGQRVVTSGEGGIFPSGIPIGLIVDSQQAEYGLYTEARVKLSANIGSLNEVWILMQ